MCEYFSLKVVKSKAYAKYLFACLCEFLYQLAVDEAKVRLNLAVFPSAWLMPARMIINTESIIGYNNQQKQAWPGMKLGINNDINKHEHQKSVSAPYGGGNSKINRPNSHP